MKCDFYYNTSTNYDNGGTNINDRGEGHLNSDTHLQNQERLEFYSS